MLSVRTKYNLFYYTVYITDELDSTIDRSSYKKAEEAYNKTMPAGENLAEQMLGNPYDLLRNSAKQNTIERKLAKENLHQELLARFKDKSSQSPAAQATPQQRPLPPAEKLAAAQVAGKKVMLDKNSTLQDRTDAYATVVEAQRGVKISKQAAKSRKRNTKLANALKKNS